MITTLCENSFLLDAMKIDLLFFFMFRNENGVYQTIL